jgi:SNF2 family DNA or RNA helicase
MDPDRRADDGETLDRAQLRRADWILTTYETLTDHERAFAPIEYGLVLFDEMQKVKAPDTLNTKAAKAMNARFVIGMTGTPIENRMEDLWCIFDRVTPGYLGDLKTFSSQYNEAQPDNLRALKAKLDSPVAGGAPPVTAPPVMKRRMKADILEGLPEKTEVPYVDLMPLEQASAYRQLVGEALRHRERSLGYMLKVLHGMRGISLHPDDASRADVSTANRFEAFASRSARLTRMIAILRDIAARGEKALIFVEFLGMQQAVADGVAALFGLRHRLDVINGSVPGERRLGIVERFSSRGLGFDALVLSPRAAGVGLNITAANHVIHLSLPEGSFDQRLDRLLRRKRKLSREMLAPPTSDSDVNELFGATVVD